MRSFTLVCAGCLLIACGNDLVSPSRPFSSLAPAAARASDALTLSSGSYSASAISLGWNDNARNEGGWEVHRSTTGVEGAFALRASLPANSTSHADTGLDPLTGYCYRVRSFRRQGPNTSYSPFSNASCSTTFGPPAAPTALEAMPPSSREVRVTWTDNAATESAVRVERAADVAGPWQAAATLGANATTYSEGRLPEQLVCYRAIAVNTWGESAPSNTDCTAPPEVPGDIAATSANATSIDVTWTDASSVEDGYEVQRALDDFVWSVIANLPAGATSYNDAAIIPDTRHWYRVRARKDGGFSYFSGYVSAAAASRPPDAPQFHGATPAGSHAAQLYFTASITTTSIRVERSPDGLTSWTTAGTQSAADGYFYDGDRTPETLLCYRVFASNAIGESAASGVDCTTPPAGPTNLAMTDNGDGTSTVTWTDNSSVEDAYEVWTVYCDDWSGCFSNYYTLEANSTALVLGCCEYFDAVYAMHDGGYSDAGTWAAAGVTAALRSVSPVQRPVKGAQATRPSSAARAARLTDRSFTARRLPNR